MSKPVTKPASELPVAVQPTPAVLLSLAIEKGINMDQLEKLMELQERWEKKEAKKAYHDALSRFQGMMPKIRKKDTAKIKSDRGEYSYKYAGLDEVVSAIRKPLAACGLSYRWEPGKVTNGRMEVSCIISHRDGHEERTTLDADIDTSGGKNKIQQVGSTVTYLQRYSLIGALGLSTADEDNDGKGSPATPAAKKQAPKAPKPPTGADDEALEQWRSIVNGTKSQIELTGLYAQNKKTVDKYPDVQAIFKQRQDHFKQQIKPQPIILP